MERLVIFSVPSHDLNDFLMTLQVIRAAQTLVAQPTSDTLQKNMSIFREGWVENVTLLTSSVDAIAPLLDFLVVTGEQQQQQQQQNDPSVA